MLGLSIGFLLTTSRHVVMNSVVTRIVTRTRKRIANTPIVVLRTRSMSRNVSSIGVGPMCS